MGQPKNILSYPPHYFQLMERAISSGMYITVPFREFGKAKSFQMRFGAFRRALQRSDSPAHEAMALASYGIQIRIRGTNVILGPVVCEDEVIAALEAEPSPIRPK